MWALTIFQHWSYEMDLQLTKVGTFCQYSFSPKQNYKISWSCSTFQIFVAGGRLRLLKSLSPGMMSVVIHWNKYLSPEGAVSQGPEICEYYSNCVQRYLSSPVCGNLRGIGHTNSGIVTCYPVFSLGFPLCLSQIVALTPNTCRKLPIYPIVWRQWWSSWSWRQSRTTCQGCSWRCPCSWWRSSECWWWRLTSTWDPVIDTTDSHLSDNKTWNWICQRETTVKVVPKKCVFYVGNAKTWKQLFGHHAYFCSTQSGKIP